MVSLKVGDTAPVLTARIELDGSLPDLTGATATFAMKNFDGVKVRAPATVDAVARTVSYAWQDPDTDTAGDYDGEFVVTFLDHTEGTYPTDPYVQYIGVTIIPCIGDRPVPTTMPLIFDGSWKFDGTQQFNGRKVLV